MVPHPSLPAGAPQVIHKVGTGGGAGGSGEQVLAQYGEEFGRIAKASGGGFSLRAQFPVKIGVHSLLYRCIRFLMCAGETDCDLPVQCHRPRQPLI